MRGRGENGRALCKATKWTIRSKWAAKIDSKLFRYVRSFKSIEANKLELITWNT